MSHDSWHARWYRTWVELGGEPPKFKENLCHYVRVLLFWAPLRCFMFWRLVKFITPAMVVGTAGFVAGLSFIGLNWPGNFLHGLKIVGYILGVVIGAVAVILGLIEWSDRFPKGFKFFWKWISTPLWAPPRGLKWAWKWAMRRTYFVRAGFMRWYFYRFYLKVINPAVVTGLGLLTAFFYLKTHLALKLLQIVGEGVGGIIGAILVLMLIFWIKDRKRFWNSLKDTTKVAATYLSTKKQGSLICPFIEFDEAQAS
jgi:hypothetical protein